MVYAREGDADVERAVADRVKELRPAGVRYKIGKAALTRVQVTVELTLAGSGVAQAELSTLKAGVETRLTKQLEVLPPGGLATMGFGPAGARARAR